MTVRSWRGPLRGRRNTAATAVLLIAMAVAHPAAGNGQQSGDPLAFQGATVVDVQTGQLHAAQTVVVVGNRIQAVGSDGAVKIPKGARIVDARGKYLIPGLWDMHFHQYLGHPSFPADPEFVYPLLVANGITGFRDPIYAGHSDPDTLKEIQRAIAAGTLVGPRFIYTDFYVEENPLDNTLYWSHFGGDSSHPIATPADGRAFIDSLKARGTAFAKLHPNSMRRDLYFAILNEGRRVGLPVVGHLPKEITLIEAADSGQHSLEHFYWLWEAGQFRGTCDGDSASVASCRALATHLRQRNTWLVPTVALHHYTTILDPEQPSRDTLYSRLPYIPDSMRVPAGAPAPLPEEWPRVFALMSQADMPILAGTDVVSPMPVLVHEDLSTLVKLGMTPLQALQAATLNPAKYLNGTDSLGTVAVGKLADLVLLDGNPLTRIQNTAAVRAVMANGRYFDRTALDSLLAGSERARRASVERDGAGP